ncbi:MAG: hypothetical protein K8T90_05250 [Planctomycetes bacterium]|nr:hypothetical protein [Planctomycetota bacterium]
MTREEILAEIDAAGRLLRSLRAQRPSDRLLEYAEQMLTALRIEVVGRWPLESPDDVSIGRFVVRAFDDESYPELVTRLVRIDAMAKGRGRGTSSSQQGGSTLQPPQ